MIYLIENMKSFPQEWHARNMNPSRKDPARPNLIIGNIMNVEREKIINAVREITHGDENKGKSPLALGIRDGNIEISVKVKKDTDKESLTLKFPE